MKIARFSPPANVDDFGSAALLQQYSDHISADFDRSIAAIAAVLAKNHAGAAQIYNPVTDGLTDPDTLADITWNGFPRKFLATQPGQKTNYAAAEPDPQHLPTSQGIRFRPQDEYLEWFVHRAANNKIVRVDFTCEAYDYFEFLGSANPAAVVQLYKTYVDGSASQAVLFPNNGYDAWNTFNLDKGAMHLTHPANALGAEIKLAADATLRRTSHGTEPQTPAALIKCAQYGDGSRNSDPKIGFEVNQLARAGYAITLTDPVGLYMVGFDDAGWQFADGTPAVGFMNILRGKAGKAIRARYEVPAALAAQGKTVSDIEIGGVPIQYGGQIAEHITMGIQGAACRKGTINNKPVPCGPVPEVQAMPNALLVPHARFA
jgi:hypothetical protein